MSDIIFRHEGTVDKYMGDAIMAFWGAPRAQPDHARLACLTAIEMAEALEQAEPGAGRRGLPGARDRHRTARGPMSVGNMGSERRFDYTVMGDAVNLGARLEEPEQGVLHAIITPRRRSRRRPHRADPLSGPGGGQGQARADSYSGADNARQGRRLEAALAACERAMDHYQNREYLEALPHFAEARRLDPSDGPTAVYLERCRDLAETRGADWDGVYVMTRK